MKKILGLVASQRKLANGEILLKEAASATGCDYQLEMLRLADLSLKPCKGCYACLTPGKQCILNDDLYFVMDKIKAADAIILAVPCYVLGPAAVTKVFGDRMIAIAQLIDELWGKPCIVIATYGIEGWEGYTLSALNALVKFMGFDLKDSQMFLGALPGESLIEEGALTRARQMGGRLFNQARQAQAGECPTCWSDVWKHSQSGSVVCPYCGQTATLATVGNSVQWLYGSSGTRLEKENLKEHFQVWLRKKVQEFLSRRNELAEVRNRYKGDDIWLSPSSKKAAADKAAAE